jgi:hypothetical protein
MSCEIMLQAQEEQPMLKGYEAVEISPGYSTNNAGSSRFAPKIFSKWYEEMGLKAGLLENNAEFAMLPIDFSLAIGYDLSPKLTLKIPVNLQFALLIDETDEISSSVLSLTAGLAAGYNIFESGFTRIQLTAEAGHTIMGSAEAATNKTGINDWKYFYYSAGGRLYIGRQDDLANGFIGMNFGRYISRINDTPNYSMMNIMLGFSIRLLKRNH